MISDGMRQTPSRVRASGEEILACRIGTISPIILSPNLRQSSVVVCVAIYTQQMSKQSLTSWSINSGRISRTTKISGLSEVLSGLGVERLEGLLHDIIANAQLPRSTIHEGFMSLLVYLPGGSSRTFLRPHPPFSVDFRMGETFAGEEGQHKAVKVKWDIADEEKLQTLQKEFLGDLRQGCSERAGIALRTPSVAEVKVKGGGIFEK
ncbi:hypothetical protein BU15DRAFT_64983 [Melanogaster broomeanus]|nr:hypothetical protein BU15DRAFT_64983 [Melanogaster broomeanus]